MDHYPALKCSLIVFAIGLLHHFIEFLYRVLINVVLNNRLLL